MRIAPQRAFRSRVYSGARPVAIFVIGQLEGEIGWIFIKAPIKAPSKSLKYMDYYYLLSYCLNVLINQYTHVCVCVCALAPHMCLIFVKPAKPIFPFFGYKTMA